MSSRRAARVAKLRAKLRKKHASLAEEFDYRLFYVYFYKDASTPPDIFEAEKVALSMTNNQQSAIMAGVKAMEYTEEEAQVLLHRDTVQVHAARWFSLTDCTANMGVSNMDFKCWPRTELERLEVLCFSRWRASSSSDEPYKLMSMRFVQHQDMEISHSILPYIVHSVKGRGGRSKGGIIFNKAQNIGLWITPSVDCEPLEVRMTSTMLCFGQEELTRWESDVACVLPPRCSNPEKVLAVCRAADRMKPIGNLVVREHPRNKKMADEKQVRRAADSSRPSKQSALALSAPPTSTEDAVSSQSAMGTSKPTPSQVRRAGHRKRRAKKKGRGSKAASVSVPVDSAQTSGIASEHASNNASIVPAVTSPSSTAALLPGANGARTGKVRRARKRKGKRKKKNGGGGVAVGTGAPVSASAVDTARAIPLEVGAGVPSAGSTQVTPTDVYMHCLDLVQTVVHRAVGLASVGSGARGFSRTPSPPRRAVGHLQVCTPQTTPAMSRSSSTSTGSTEVSPRSPRAAPGYSRACDSQLADEDSDTASAKDHGKAGWGSKAAPMRLASTGGLHVNMAAPAVRPADLPAGGVSVRGLATLASLLLSDSDDSDD